MKRMFVILIFLPLIGQGGGWTDAAYRGGKGDGHAMGELIMEATSVHMLTHDKPNAYPNPISATKPIIYLEGVQESDNLQVLDILGRPVACSLKFNGILLEMDLSGIIPGHYVIVIEGPAGGIARIQVL